MHLARLTVICIGCGRYFTPSYALDFKLIYLIYNFLPLLGVYKAIMPLLILDKLHRSEIRLNFFSMPFNSLI